MIAVPATDTVDVTARTRRVSPRLCGGFWGGVWGSLAGGGAGAGLGSQIGRGQDRGLGDGRDLLPATLRDPLRPARRPGQRRVARAQDAPGRLDQEPAHPRIAAFRDAAPEPVIRRAVLTRDQAEIQFDLVRAVEPRHGVQRGDERDRR